MLMLPQQATRQIVYKASNQQGNIFNAGQLSAQVTSTSNFIVHKLHPQITAGKLGQSSGAKWRTRDNQVELLNAKPTG